MNKTLILVLSALFSLTACSVERVSLFPSYKLKIIQGNELATASSKNAAI